MQKLDKVLAKGKHIMQLTEICSKYETEREKLQPFKSQSNVENLKQVPDQSNEVLDDFKKVGSLFNFFAFRKGEGTRFLK